MALVASIRSSVLGLAFPVRFHAEAAWRLKPSSFSEASVSDNPESSTRLEKTEAMSLTTRSVGTSKVGTNVRTTIDVTLDCDDAVSSSFL